MKNKEKYANEIIAIACNDRRFAVDKNTNEVLACGYTDCNDCAFVTTGNCCSLQKRNEWAESEYKEPITAKRLREEFNQMCLNTGCGDCKYRATNCNHDCHYDWLLEHYNVTEKEVGE